jgi:hypothetical protein
VHARSTYSSRWGVMAGGKGVRVAGLLALLYFCTAAHVAPDHVSCCPLSAGCARSALHRHV